VVGVPDPHPVEPFALRDARHRELEGAQRADTENLVVVIHDLGLPAERDAAVSE